MASMIGETVWSARLQLLRLGCRWTITELAERIGLSTVSVVLHGRRPSVRFVIRLNRLEGAYADKVEAARRKYGGMRFEHAQYGFDLRGYGGPEVAGEVGAGTNGGVTMREVFRRVRTSGEGASRVVLVLARCWDDAKPHRSIEIRRPPGICSRPIIVIRKRGDLRGI